MSGKNVIIIGAGPAGLTAAYRLLRQTDAHPIILEESPYIGGISRTAVYKGNRMDIGGHRFFSKNAEVLELWRELMPDQGAPAWDDRILGRQVPLAAGGPDPEREEKVMLLRERVSRILYLRHFFDYPISLTPRMLANMGLMRTLKAGLGYVAACVRKREEKSLEDFYINRFGKPLYEMFFEDYTEKLWGVHPSQIAPDWGAQRVKGLSLRKAVTEFLTRPFRHGEAKETSLIGQFSYPKRGPGQLWEELARRIEELGGEIRMQTRVTGLECGQGRIEAVRVTDASGTERRLEGDAFFSTMPVKDLVLGMGEATPDHVRQIASALPYRDFITVGLLLKKLAIRNSTKKPTVGGIVPDCWIYIQERDVRLGRLQIFNNWSPYMVERPAESVFVGLEYFCSEGDAMWNMDEAAFIDFAIGELTKIGVIRREDVLDATHIRVKKAYPAYFGSYAQFPVVRRFLDGWENLYCIGRNGQHRYNNMDHSMLTAMEAVRVYQSGSGDKSSIWSVNTEESYHEEREKNS